MPTAVVVALFEVSAESGGPAVLNGLQDAPLHGAEGDPVLKIKGLSVAAEDIRHFELRSLHGSAG
jgi:hypothetical protein